MSKIYLIKQHTIDGKTVWPFKPTDKYPSSARYTDIEGEYPSANMGKSKTAQVYNQYYDCIDIPSDAIYFGFLYLQIDTQYKLSYEPYKNSSSSVNPQQGNARVFKMPSGKEPSISYVNDDNNAVSYIRVCDHSINSAKYSYFAVDKQYDYIIDYFFEYNVVTEQIKNFLLVSTSYWDGDKRNALLGITLTSSIRTVKLENDKSNSTQWYKEWYSSAKESVDWTIKVDLAEGYSVGTDEQDYKFKFYHSGSLTAEDWWFKENTFKFDFSEMDDWRLDFNIVTSSSIKSGDLYVWVNGVQKRLMVYKVDDYGKPVGNPIGHLVAK